MEFEPRRLAADIRPDVGKEVIERFGIAPVDCTDEDDARRSCIISHRIIRCVRRYPGQLGFGQQGADLGHLVGRSEEDDLAGREPAEFGFQRGFVKVERLAAGADAVGPVGQEVMHQTGVDRGALQLLEHRAGRAVFCQRDGGRRCVTDLCNQAGFVRADLLAEIAWNGDFRTEPDCGFLNQPDGKALPDSRRKGPVTPAYLHSAGPDDFACILVEARMYACPRAIAESLPRGEHDPDVHSGALHHSQEGLEIGAVA